jgi:hypothetical protein
LDEEIVAIYGHAIIRLEDCMSVNGSSGQGPSTTFKEGDVAYDVIVSTVPTLTGTVVTALSGLPVVGGLVGAGASYAVKRNPEKVVDATLGTATAIGVGVVGAVAGLVVTPAILAFMAVNAIGELFKKR